MPRDTKQFKAIYFDLRIKDLEQHYSEKAPKGAYQRIKKFMEGHNFEHAQYSGYHSVKKMTDLEVVDLVEVMRDALPWLGKSANHFEVTNIGANSDLTFIHTLISEKRRTTMKKNDEKRIIWETSILSDDRTNNSNQSTIQPTHSEFIRDHMVKMNAAEINDYSITQEKQYNNSNSYPLH